MQKKNAAQIQYYSPGFRDYRVDALRIAGSWVFRDWGLGLGFRVGVQRAPKLEGFREVWSLGLGG